MGVAKNWIAALSPWKTRPNIGVVRGLITYSSIGSASSSIVATVAAGSISSNSGAGSISQQYSAGRIQDLKECWTPRL